MALLQHVHWTRWLALILVVAVTVGVTAIVTADPRVFAHEVAEDPNNTSGGGDGTSGDPWVGWETGIAATFTPIPVHR